MKWTTKIKLHYFYELLEIQYTKLFKSDPSYTYVALCTDPKRLARKIASRLVQGGEVKDTKAVKNVCKKLGIGHTYAAIRAYLAEE